MSSPTDAAPDIKQPASIDADLATLRDGSRAEKIAARERLARVFERRDLLDYAAECLEANVLDGVRDPLLYERLASIYDRQGDAERADQARAAARKLIARQAPSPTFRVPSAGPTILSPSPEPVPAVTAKLPSVTPPKDDPLASLVEAALKLPPRAIIAGAGGFLALGLLLVILAGATAGTRTAAVPTPTLGVSQFAEPTPEAARVDPTVAALIGQVAQIQATAQAAQGGSDPTPPATPRSIGSEAAPAVEALRAVAAFILTDSGSGSGVSLGGGRFVTNHHVIDGASVVAVRLADGRSAQATIRSVDPTRDLALLETSLTDARAARLRASSAIQPAENLYVVGYPMGTRLGIEEITVTRGIFSARRQARSNVWHVQTDAPMNPGNSGGPVGDGDGNVVGLATWGLRGSDGLNFAVASDEVTAFLEGGGSPPPPARAQAPVPVLPAAPAPAAAAPPPAVTVRPQLMAAAFGPAGVEPGGTVGLRYEIINGGSAPVTVVLGASIRLGNGPWIDDSTNDARVRVAPGRATYSRSFRIPTGTPSGSYDVWVSMLSDDMKTSFGQRSASDGLTVAMRQAPPAAPAVAAAPPPTAVPRPPATSTPLPPPRSPTAAPRAPTNNVASAPAPVIVQQATPRPAPTNTAVPAPPTSTPRNSSTFDPKRFVGQGDKYNCGDFASQAQAQAVLRADPSDPNRLDQGGVPGVACEDRPPPYDRAPVSRR